MGEYLLKCLLILLLLSLHVESFKGGDTLCKQNERKALLTFKQSLQDDYGMLSSWEEHQNKECCEWEGVHCNNKTGHVETLHLQGTDSYHLQGLINPSLIELSHLTHLDLSQNYLNGTPVPEFIGYLKNLRHLNLSHAHFSGRVPHQFGFLQHLKYLDLKDNQLEGIIPSQLGNLSRLLYLDMSSNNLVGSIPSQLGNLSTLHSLRLAHNDGLDIHADAEWISRLSSSLMHLDLSGMPKLKHSNNLLQQIGQLPKLRELELAHCELSDAKFEGLSQTNSNFTSSLSILDLSGNKLASSTVFMWIFNFSLNLHELHLEENNLEGPIPNGFGSMMSSLESLDLYENNLKGAIPNSFGNMCNLMWLSLSYNLLSGDLSGIIPNSTRCGHVQHPLRSLNVAYNQISGTIPEVSMFSSLGSLILFGNQLHGNIPESIGLLSSLEELYLGSNSIEGIISESHLSSLSRLKDLDLRDNSLAFKVHENWVPPFQLTFLNVASCKLGPNFPKWLQIQKELEYLDISNVEISDVVPQQFWDVLSNMRNLNMSNNNLRGTIPADLTLNVTNDGQYRQIVLDSNEFDGSIPSFLLKAHALHLSNNQFSSISWFQCGNNITTEDVSSLLVLDASSNQLTGQLPECWHHLKYLQILDLKNNKLSGKIPTSIGNLVDIQVLSLRNNSLTGELPSSLSNCTELQMLDVGENLLSGFIPSWIGERLQKLVVLSIRVNKFYGTLPLHLCYLTQIQILDASENSIIGEIPACLENFTAMNHEIFRLKSDYSNVYAYYYSANIFWKGVEYVFSNPELRLNTIDLSSNKLIGGMPKEVGNLIGLISLNLSRNSLSGEITSNLGNLKSLEFLDLSRNHFTGNIPSSLVGIDRLTGIDVSNNHLSGKIPVGTQLQSFPVSSYENNSGLCGKPLDIICPEDEARVPVEAPNSIENGNSDFLKALYMSMGIGFATGFWGFLGLTMLKRSWRCAYYRFLQDLEDKIYVLIVLNWRKYHN